LHLGTNEPFLITDSDVGPIGRGKLLGKRVSHLGGGDMGDDTVGKPKTLRSEYKSDLSGRKVD